MIVFLNGKWVPEKKAAISIDDHGFLYGDGVYETIRVYKRKPFLLSQHLRRLNNSMLGIRLSPPMSLMQLGHAVQGTIDKNKHSDAVVRITITRGPGERGLDPSLCLTPTVLITSRPLTPYPIEHYRKGITAAVVSIRRNPPESLPPSIKSTSCLNTVLAKIESLDVGAQEAILLSREENVTEGTVSNVFLVKKRMIFTPRLEGDLLEGVTREWVCRMATQAGYRLREKAILVKDLVEADEIFLTSTIMEILPVSRLIFRSGGQQQNVKGRVGPITQDLLKRFRVATQRFSQI